MITKVIFRGIKFYNIYPKNFSKYIIKKGLFVFPAGPALATIDHAKKLADTAIITLLLARVQRKAPHVLLLLQIRG